MVMDSLIESSELASQVVLSVADRFVTIINEFYSYDTKRFNLGH